MNIAELSSMTPEALDQLIGQLQELKKLLEAKPETKLDAARRIAGETSLQTGKNYKNFTNGRYDHAFGVRCATAAIEWGQRNPGVK